MDGSNVPQDQISAINNEEAGLQITYDRYMRCSLVHTQIISVMLLCFVGATGVLPTTIYMHKQ